MAMGKAPLHVLGPTISFSGGTFLLEDVVDFQLRFFFQWSPGWQNLITNSKQEDDAAWAPPDGSPLKTLEGYLIVPQVYDLYIMGMAVSDRALALRAMTQLLGYPGAWRTFSGPVLAEKGYALTQPLVVRGGHKLRLEGSIGAQPAPRDYYTVDLICILVRHHRADDDLQTDHRAVFPEPTATPVGQRCARCHDTAPNAMGCATCNPVQLGVRLAAALLELDALKAGLNGPAGTFTMLDQANNANHRAHTQLDEARVPQCGDLTARIAWLVGQTATDSSSRKKRIKRKAKKK
jgi:hypothetical protein